MNNLSQKKETGLNEQEREFLMSISSKSFLEIKSHLEKEINQIDISKVNNIFLKQAAVRGDLDIIKLLIEHGADPTVSSNYPLRAVAIHDNLEIIKYFIIELKQNPDILIQEQIEFVPYNIKLWAKKYKNTQALHDHLDSNLEQKNNTTHYKTKI